MKEQWTLDVLLCDLRNSVHLFEHTVYTPSHDCVQTSSKIGGLDYPDIVLAITLSLVELSEKSRSISFQVISWLDGKRLFYFFRE